MSDKDNLLLLLRTIANTKLKVSATVNGMDDDYEIYTSYNDVIAEDSTGSVIAEVKLAQEDKNTPESTAIQLAQLELAQHVMETIVRDCPNDVKSSIVVCFESAKKLLTL